MSTSESLEEAYENLAKAMKVAHDDAIKKFYVTFIRALDKAIAEERTPSAYFLRAMKIVADEYELRFKTGTTVLS